MLNGNIIPFLMHWRVVCDALRFMKLNVAAQASDAGSLS